MVFKSLKRWLAVGSAAAIASVGVLIAPTQAVADSPADQARAANFIVRNLPAKADGASASMTAALGLAATGECTYAPSLRTLVKQIEKGAKAYLYPSKKLNQARAANLAIVVKALGLNPKKFAGYNLVSLVTKSLPADGRIGPSTSAFSQSLGIIALQRAGATIPVTLLTNLLGQQGDDGSFGFEYPAGTFNADPDTTALGIQALNALGSLTPQVNAAIGWAEDEQTSDGYWEAYSPVDSTALLGSALASGDAVNAAKAWLATVQNSDGGFPNSLDEGTDSDVTATANALFLITGKSLLDVSLNLKGCPTNPPKLPAATSTCTGVWVVVDRGNGQSTVRCATKYATGLDALKSAGFSLKTFNTQYGAAICQIQKFPLTCDTTFGSGYWSYWNAEQNEDGTWGDWGYAATGAGTSTPAKGVAEGFTWVPSSSSSTGEPSLKPPAGYETVPVPTISGEAKVGQTLTVDSGAWAPEPDKLAIQWYRNGKAISKATKESYKLTKSDAGKVITVKVTASGKGLQTLGSTSAPTAKVAK